MIADDSAPAEVIAYLINQVRFSVAPFAFAGAGSARSHDSFAHAAAWIGQDGGGLAGVVSNAGKPGVNGHLATVQTGQAINASNTSTCDCSAMGYAAP